MWKKETRESVRGEALLIWRLNEPSGAFDTSSDLLWSLAEWHHSGEERGGGVGGGQGKKKVWIIDGFQIPSNWASKGGSCGRQWKRAACGPRAGSTPQWVTSSPRAPCEHLGVWYCAQWYVGSTLKLSWHLPLLLQHLQSLVCTRDRPVPHRLSCYQFVFGFF